MMRKFLKSKSVFYIYLFLLIFPCFELALLILGYRSYQQVGYEIVSQPQNCIIASANKGFALQPGSFEVSINKGLNYQATHNDDSVRISSISSIQDTIIRPQILLFGCSYTYGMGLSDNQTFGYQLQTALPQFEIINCGVPGYGTVQTYIQLQEHIAHGGKPDIAMINFADFHLERNTLNHNFRRDLYMGFQRSYSNMESFDHRAAIPFIQQSNNQFQVQHEPWNNLYQNWKAREKLASVNFLQTTVESWKESESKNKLATLFIFNEIKALCDKHDIKLIVTGLTQNEVTHIMLQSLTNLGIQTQDISVDLRLAGYNNMPYDSHPNAAAHRHYASEILKLIRHD